MLAEPSDEGLSSSCGILTRIPDRASCASSFWSRSPASRAAIMSRPETPRCPKRPRTP